MMICSSILCEIFAILTNKKVYQIHYFRWSCARPCCELYFPDPI